MTSTNVLLPVPTGTDHRAARYPEFHLQPDLVPDPLVRGPRPYRTGPWIVAAGQAWSERWAAPLGQSLATPDSKLHRRLARTRLDAGAILAQSRRLGLLEDGMSLVKPDGDRFAALTGESVEAWRDAIRELRVLIALWDGISVGNGHLLRPFVRWTYYPKREVAIVVVHRDGDLLDARVRSLRRLVDNYQTGVARAKAARDRERIRSLGVALDQQLVALFDMMVAEDGGEHLQSTEALLNADDVAPLVAKWRDEDAIEPLRWYVHREVNRRLLGQVSPQLGATQHSGIVNVPHTLLAQVYLAFAQEIARGVPVMATCGRVGCDVEFEWRSNKTYCSPRCKNLANYHRRKERAT